MTAFPPLVKELYMPDTTERLRVRIDQLTRRSQVIGGTVWAVAGLMILFSLGTGTELLLDHDVPWPLAWMPSLAADVALCTALIGDQVLSEHDEGTRWGTALRWLAAAVALGFNTGLSWTAHDGSPDWAGVGIHAAPIVVLIVATEAAQAYRRTFARIIERMRQQLAGLVAVERDAEARARADAEAVRAAERAAEDDRALARAEAERSAAAAREAAELAAAERVRAERQGASGTVKTRQRKVPDTAPAAGASVSTADALAAALKHRDTAGELPGPADLMRLTGASRSTADRALRQAREQRGLHLATASA